MEATYLSSRGIVQEVLTKHNYKRWKSLMINYLVGKDLWDIVEGDLISEIEPRTWRKKNAEALHIIQLSCEPKIIDEISGFDTAKEAWDHLGLLHDPDLKAKPDIEQGVVLDDDLDEDRRKLYGYMKKGDRKRAEGLLLGNGHDLCWAPASGRTVLHVATMAGHVHMVRMLIRKGREELLKKTDSKGYTALALAAQYTGNKDVAELMVNFLEENERGSVVNELLTTPNNEGKIPLLLAAAAGHKEMTRYLYEKTPEDVRYSPSNRILLLEFCIKAEIFGVAERLHEFFPKLPDESLDRGFAALGDLAQKPSAFSSGCQCGWLKKINRIYRAVNEQECTYCLVKKILNYFRRRVAEFDNSQLKQASVYDAMLNAAKHGNVDFIDAMSQANPDLLWVTDSQERDIFSYAVLHRKQNVFQLIYTLTGGKDIVKYRKDVFGNNLLHLAGYLGPFSDLTQNPGAALQMQREIHWFQAVEKVVHPKCKEEKNNDGKKPHEVFAETHQKLQEEGEKWAKVTAKSFSLVATLLSSITFAALFTLPGGNDEETGVPIFLHDTMFTLFIIANAISLFSSITSVLIFIHILISRFSQDDFLKSLPWKLLAGLFFLFLSVISMVIASSAELATVLKKDKGHARLIITIIFGCFPVMVVLCHVELMRKISLSTISNPISHIKCKSKEAIDRCMHGNIYMFV